MQIHTFKNYDGMSLEGANILLSTIKANPQAILCLATGGSPALMYQIFVEEINTHKIDISQVTFVKLDEWYGVDPQEPFTCTTFIKENLLDKLYMQPKQVIEMMSNAEDVQKEIEKMDSFLKENPVDVMILGLGMNGHLGLNEPNEYLTLASHQAQLHETTKTHDMANGRSLTSGLTIGMEGIFQSKQVLMLVCGTRKEEAYAQFMSKKITTKTPASFLWLHPNCITLVDEEISK